MNYLASNSIWSNFDLPKRVYEDIFNDKDGSLRSVFFEGV